MKSNTYVFFVMLKIIITTMFIICLLCFFNIAHFIKTISFSISLNHEEIFSTLLLGIFINVVAFYLCKDIQ